MDSSTRLASESGCRQMKTEVVCHCNHVMQTEIQISKIDLRSSQGSVTNMASDGEDDYLTMTFQDPPPVEQVVETYSQRRARKLREHETKSRIKPAKELEQERREEGLAKNLFAENEKKESKAMRMMKLMGYTYILWL